VISNDSAPNKPLGQGALTLPVNAVWLRLAGGLGNQLFQLAAALVCARQWGWPVVPVTGGLGTYARPHEATSLRLVRSKRLLAAQPPSKSLSWLAAHTRVGRWMPWLGVNDRTFPAICHGPRRGRPLALMDGYFQRGWTQDLLTQALAMMTVQTAVPVPRLPYDCIVHVRGTDFLGLQSHGFLQPDYYANAVALAKGAGLRRFGVVTDDPSHGARLAAHIGEAHPDVMLSVLPAASDPLHDFHVIRSAPARIMGNSTFAWWAAALDANAAPTWSCARFVRDQSRDFFLKSEIPLDVQGRPCGGLA
jgi:hypothetical protein